MAQRWLQNGPLIVTGCADYLPDAVRLTNAAGTYWIRLSVSELRTVSKDGLQGHDHFRMQLRLAPHIAPWVLNQDVV